MYFKFRYRFVLIFISIFKPERIIFTSLDISIQKPVQNDIKMNIDSIFGSSKNAWLLGCGKVYQCIQFSLTFVRRGLHNRVN